MEQTREEPIRFDGIDWEGLNNTLATWEPQFEALNLSSEQRLYEPDGTLYAIVLDGRSELRTDRRRQRIEPGDLVVVPQSVAVEVEPAAGFLGLRVGGPPPYHFRERFIQVQGFEHVPSASTLDDDARHRIGYRVVTLDGGDGQAIPLPLAARALLVPLGAEVSWKGRGEDFTQAERGNVTLTEETARLVLKGSGRVALFVLSTSESHQARRLAIFAQDARAVSPEPSKTGDRRESGIEGSGTG